MIVLGIDPGFSVTGFGIVKKEGSRIVLLDYGLLKLSQTYTLEKRVMLFHEFFTQKINHWHIEMLSLETPFLGKNAQTFLKLGYLRGITYLLAATYNIRLTEFSPREVKLALTGFGGADKEQVARMIKRLFPAIVLPAKLDVTDALSVALCGLWKQKREQIR